ncbi:fimbrial protein [Brenneria sp. 4F2]|nr:fimbrial protein [Brenneria bubanii]
MSLKNVIRTAVLASIPLVASSVFAADGTINFTGTVLNSACSVDSTATSTTVSLGNVSAASLGSVGSFAGGSPFKISMTNCPTTVSAASITFDGNSADGKTLSLDNLGGTGIASGVGVALFEADGVTRIPLSTASKFITLDTSATSVVNTLNFIAKYVAIDTVSPGTANSSTNFTITYQ